MNRQAKRIVAAVLALTILVAGVNRPRLEAMVVPVEVAADASSMDRTQDLKTVQTILENKVVRQRLADMGLTEDEINSRLNRLSDTQLHQAALQIDKQVAAGDDNDVWIGLGIGFLVVLLIVWLMDAIDD